MNIRPRTLPDVAAAYGLSDEEADRALRWAQIAKTAARGGRSFTRLPLLTEPKFDREGRTWCKQCERRVSKESIIICQSQWCKAKDAV